MNSRIIVVTVVLSAVIRGALAQGVPHAFTFQGSLTNASGGALPDGQRSMQFKLFNAETSGSLLWESGAMNVVTTNGIFSVALGASPTPPISSATLPSDGVWVEVTVGDDTLSPRTKLASTPFALRAGVADSVSDASITSTKIADGTIQLADIGQNGASANQVIKRNSTNTKWTVADDNDTDYWTEASGNIHRPAGYVGIGLSAPNRKLYINENIGGLSYPLKLDNPHSTPGDATGVLFSAGGSGNNVLDTGRGKGAFVYEYKSTWNRGDFHFLQEPNANPSNPTLANSVLTIRNDGNVGIRSSNPGFPLTFSDTLGDKISLWGQSGNSYGIGIQSNLLQFHTLGANNDIAFGYGSSASMTENMRIKGDGSVGIGTSTPGATLHVLGGTSKAIYGKSSNPIGTLGYGVYGEAGYDGGVGVCGKNVTNNNFGHLGSNDRGAYGRHVSGNAGSLGGSDYGVKAEGDLVVSGAFRGSLGTNNGAPFPRPAYNSGWQTITAPTANIHYHNLGGSVDDYVVDLQFKNDVGTIHNRGFGMYPTDPELLNWSGACMVDLNNSYYRIFRPLGDTFVNKFRVRIWICN